MRPQDVSFATTLGGVYFAIVLAMCASMSACASQPAKLPPPAPVQASLCLPLVAYSPDQQKALAAQLKTLSADSPVSQALVDYERMRDSDRACLSSK